LAAAVRIPKHALQALIVFEHVDVLEAHLSPAEVLTGSRGVGSEILSENENGCGHHKCLHARYKRSMMIECLE
jgi:hypothetical protein